MSFEESPFKDFDPEAPDLSPNRYRLDCPFELLQLGIRAEETPAFTIFMANTGGTYYKNILLDEALYEANKDKTAGLHTHDYYEFLFVLEGEIYQNIDCLRHFYPRGGCCIVAPELPHTEEYNDDTSARLLFLKLQKEYVESLLHISHYFRAEHTEACRRCSEFFATSAEYLDFIPLKDLAWQQEHVYSLFRKLADLLTYPGESTSLEISVVIYRILMSLFDPSLYGNTPVPPGTEEEIRLFLEIRNFLESMPGKCTRADLEERFHFSGDYLYKVVKTHSGLSIYDFSMRICMKKAAGLLRSTDMNINDIAELLGFHNYTQFYGVFRRFYYMTPRQYRRGDAR